MKSMLSKIVPGQFNIDDINMLHVLQYFAELPNEDLSLCLHRSRVGHICVMTL